MARKNEAEVATTDATEESTPNERRRQSPLTRLKFALNNIIGVCLEAKLEDIPEVQAGQNLLADLEFDLRPSTVVTAGKIQQAMMGLDPMNDLTPRRIKKLGQLLAGAQRGDLITDADIENAAGGEIDFDGEDDGDADDVAAASDVVGSGASASYATSESESAIV